MQLGEACLQCMVHGEKYVSGAMQTDMTLLWYGLALHLPNMTHKAKYTFRQWKGKGSYKLGCRMQ